MKVILLLKILYFSISINHALGHIRKFQKPASFGKLSEIHDKNADLDLPRNYDVQDRRVQIDDGDITNNSEDTRKVLEIEPFMLTLRPTQSALTPNQISKAVTTMETLLMDKLGSESPELSLVSAVDLINVTEAEFFPAQDDHERVLFENAETAASYSVLKVDGGTANTTFSIYYDPPTTHELNIAVRKILSSNLVNILRVEEGFTQLEQVAVESYAPPSGIQTEYEIPQSPVISRGSSKPVAVSLGVIAIIFAMAGVSYYMWKKGSIQKLSGRYSQVRSNLRLKSLKRSDLDHGAKDYLVEVCTDEVESPTTSHKNMEKRHDVATLENDKSLTNDFPSPNSIKSKKQRALDRKTIDPADYVVEVGTE